MRLYWNDSQWGKVLGAGLLFLACMGSGSLLHAEEPLPDTFQLRLGGYLLADQSTDAKLTRNGVGATINLQDLFHMQTRTQVFRVDGFYHFSPKHSLQFSWYSINNTGSTDQDLNFQWGDKNISAIGSLSTHYNTDIYKINYIYSFYRNDQVALGLSAGLHIMSFDIGFSGTYTTDGTAENAGQAVKVTAPLPVVGFRLSYNLTPALSFAYSIDYFYISFEGVQGGLTDSLLNVDYRITRHFGFGFGINATNMGIETGVQDNGELKVNQRIVGGLVYGTLTF